MGTPFVVQVPPHIKPLLQDIGRRAGQLKMPTYAVGGCVRDWLLGIAETVDLDVTVEGRGIDMAQAAARALHGTLTVHQQFGTATVTLPNDGRRRAASVRCALRVDFATCRKETYAKPGAYPRVSRGTLRDDLFRRDFTINAMAVAIAPGRFGVLIDPFGGARDLRMKTLRVLHERSFLDDPTRILRGVRLLQRFALTWEPRTKRLAREAVRLDALGWLNTGRLRRELDRMLTEPDPRCCLWELAALLDAPARHPDEKSWRAPAVPETSRRRRGR